MSSKIDNALRRLTCILPLKDRQDACGEQVRDLHRQILRSFVETGRIPTREEMRRCVDDVDDALSVLRRSGMVTFSEHGEPTGAYPFTTQAREHVVQANGHQVHAMCALDALAISPMFGIGTQISSRCRVTGYPVTISQSGTTIENSDEAGDIHIGIAWAATDATVSCADSLCTEMVFLRDATVARRWLGDLPRDKEIFTLPEAVEFAYRLFVPLVN